MKTYDISDGPLVRKYGVRGARIFSRLYFPFLYVLLAAVNAASWVLAPELATSRGDRVFFGCIFGGLTVLAASLLTRMWLGLLAEIKELERRGKAP
jgi:hypothetical protein